MRKLGLIGLALLVAVLAAACGSTKKATSTTSSAASNPCAKSQLHLISAGKLTGSSLLYQAMNIAGAAGFAINGWWHRALPSAVLNILWLAIGGFASWRILKKRGSSTSAM